MADARSQRGTPLGTRYVERFLRRLFNTQGPVVTDHLRGDVSPSIDVRPSFPWDFQDFSIIPFVQTVNGGAVAGEHAYIEVQQCTLPYHVCLVRMRATVAATVRINTVTLGDLAGNAGLSRDSGVLAFETPASPTGWIVGDTVLTATVSGATAIWNLAANTSDEIPLIIRNGSANVVIINSDAPNLAATFSVWGFLIPVDAAIA